MSLKSLEEILIVTTGGTIDKVYFDQKSDYQVGQTIIGSLLSEAQVTPIPTVSRKWCGKTAWILTMQTVGLSTARLPGIQPPWL